MPVKTFLYETSPEELSLILANISYADRSIWESARISNLFVAQTHCTKRLKLRDIFSLPWDHENDAKVVDMKEYMKHMHELENILNNENESKIQEQGTDSSVRMQAGTPVYGSDEKSI